MRKRALPVIFPTEGDGGSTSPVENASDSAVAGDAGEGLGLMPASWGSKGCLLYTSDAADE